MKLKYLACIPVLVGMTLSYAAQTTVVFIQHAKSAELTRTAENTYQLTLHQPAMYVSYFSDRPERLTGIISQSKFLKFWDNKNKAKFAEIPPNTAIESEQVNLIGTLQNPQVIASGDITYKFVPLKSNTKIQSKQLLGYTVLFVDDVHWDPGGFGDTH